MIRVQMLRQVRALRVGDIVEAHDGVAELWIRYRWAMRLNGHAATGEIAEEAPRQDGNGQHVTKEEPSRQDAKTPRRRGRKRSVTSA